MIFVFSCFLCSSPIRQAKIQAVSGSQGVFRHTNPDVAAKAQNRISAETYMSNLFPEGPVTWQKPTPDLAGDMIVTECAPYAGGWLFRSHKKDPTRLYVTFLPIRTLTQQDVQSGLLRLYQLYNQVFSSSPLPAQTPTPTSVSVQQAGRPRETVQGDTQKRIRDLLFTHGDKVEGVKQGLISKETVETLYAQYLSTDLPRPPFEEWLQKHLIPPGSTRATLAPEELEQMEVLKGYGAEYKLLPEEARQMLNFYQFLLLSQAFNAPKHEKQMDHWSLTIDLTTLAALTSEWNPSNSLTFFEWFNIYMLDVFAVKSLQTARELYRQGLMMQKIKHCTFLQWVLFCVAFRYEDEEPHFRIDFDVLEYLFQNWQTSSGDSTPFEGWLLTLSWCDRRIEAQMRVHWVPLYQGFYKTRYPENSFIAFLKFRHECETNPEVQVRFDWEYAQYLSSTQSN